MKPRFHKSRLASFTLALTAGLLVTASTAQAQTYYWDNNGTDAGFGTAGGTWTVPTANLWSTDSTGIDAPGASITTTTSDALNFGTATDGLAAGTITVSGTVDANSLTFGSASGAVVLSGDTINLGGTEPTITVDNTANTISSVVSGSSLTKNGSGTLTLTAANTMSGSTVISAGKVIFTNSSAFGTTSVISVRNASSLEFGANGLNLATAVQMQNSSGSKTLQLDLEGTNTGTLSGNLDIRYSAAGDFAINIGDADTLTVSGHIVTQAGGGAGLTKTGAGTLSLSGVNTYTAATFIAAGTLVADRADVAATSGALGNGGDIKFTGGTLQYTANSAGSDYSARIKNSTSAMKFDTNGQTVTFGTALATTNTGGLTKNGTGLLDIEMGTSYSGTTTINGGTLRFTNVSDTAGVSTTAFNINNGSTLEFQSSVGGPNRTNLTGKTFTFDSNGGGTINFDGGNHLFQNAVHTFTTTGGLKNTIFRTNGAFINNQGTGNTVFDVADGSDEVDLELSAEWRNGTLTKSGAGTMAIAGVHGDNNAIAIDAGTLEIGGASSLNDGTSTAVITNDGTFKYNSSAAQELSGVISGTGALTQSGASTLTLTGANTYSGATTVSAGTLAINGTGSINNSSSVQVAAGAKLVYNSSTALTVGPVLNGATTSSRAVLGGTGPINATVTLDNVGDTLAPGNSPGVQTFEPAQTWSAFSYDWEINDFTGTTAGSDFDQVVLLDTFGLNGGSGSYILNILSLDNLNAPGDVANFSETNRSWNILTTTNGITGFDAANWTLNVAGFTNTEAGSWMLAESGGDLVLSYTAAIPEPSSSALLLGLLCSSTLLRRRHA